MNHKSRILIEKNKVKDLVVLSLLFLVGVLFVLIIKPGYLLNILIVYIPGLVYTLSKLKKSAQKILIFGVTSLLFIIPVEILARLTNSWDVASDFPRILGIAPVENVVYGLVNIFYPLAFYEYFFDNDRNRAVSSRFKMLIALYFILFCLTFLGFYINPNILKFDYWFLGLCILLPVFILLIKYKPHIIKRLIVPAIFFGLMYLIHESVSMYLGHWWWPGNYLLPINVAGFIYPLEDLVIWIVFSNMAVISGYEVMWD